MTRNDYQILEMLGRVIAFCQAFALKFPKQSFVGQALTAIEAAIAKCYQLAAIQTRASVKFHADAKEGARKRLLQQLETIQRTSRGVAIDYPGTEKAFWIPGSVNRDKTLCEVGDRFLEHLEPLKAAFVEHHLPDDFIDKFSATVEGFKQAIRDQDNAKSARKGSFAQFSEVVQEGLKQLGRVESIVTNTFHDDAVTLAAWDAARAVAKPRRKKKPGNPTVAEPDGAHATPAGAAAGVAHPPAVVAVAVAPPAVAPPALILPVVASREAAPSELVAVGSEPPKAGEEAASTTGQR